MKKKRDPKDVYTLDDLENWQEATRDITPAIRLGVLGDPVAHSLSPQMQNAALHECKIEAQYARFQIRSNELASAFQIVRQLEFAGVNLTLPHKIAALSLMDELDMEAKQIGAINTVAVRSGQLIGFNTDGVGFTRAVRTEFSVDLRDLRVMVLGAGGAARGIARQCAREKCERLVIANRTFEKASQLVNDLAEFFIGPKVLGPVARLQAIPWDERAFEFQIANIDLIVNATPLGLKRSDPSPIAARLLAPHLMVYDTVYSNGLTPLTIAAAEAGARAANGLSMLLYQGAASFEIWFRRDAPLEVMRQAMRPGN
jgi:shikimate dehydrogenase